MEEEDEYLLDINLDTLDDSLGEDQAIWLLALQAAKEAYQLRNGSTSTTADEAEEEPD